MFFICTQSHLEKPWQRIYVLSPVLEHSGSRYKDIDREGVLVMLQCQVLLFVSFRNYCRQLYTY